METTGRRLKEIEITREMYLAGVDALDVCGGEDYEVIIPLFYRAMRSAEIAPRPVEDVPHRYFGSFQS